MDLGVEGDDEGARTLVAAGSLDSSVAGFARAEGSAEFVLEDDEGVSVADPEALALDGEGSYLGASTATLPQRGQVGSSFLILLCGPAFEGAWPWSFFELLATILRCQHIWPTKRPQQIGLASGSTLSKKFEYQ